MNGPGFTDAGLAKLRRLTTLSDAWPLELPASPTQASFISKAYNLQVLGLTDYVLMRCRAREKLDKPESVGPAELPNHRRWLGEPRNLLQLNLSILDRTDHHLTPGGVHLKKLNGLQYLNLINTRVTDAGLVNLKGLGNLKIVWLGGTDVSDQGVQYCRTRFRA